MKYLYLAFIALIFPLLMAQTRQPLLPAGAVVAFATQTCPAGFIMADGTALQRTGGYVGLFSAIGTAHGTTNASNFLLPDYRGRFLRGVAKGSTNDPDRASRTAMGSGGLTGDNVGSVQGHAFQTHTHTQSAHRHITAYHASGTVGHPYNPGYSGTINSPNTQYSDYQTPAIQNASASGANSQASSNESRPVNAYVIYCVKY